METDSSLSGFVFPARGGSFGADGTPGGLLHSLRLKNAAEQLPQMGEPAPPGG